MKTTDYQRGYSPVRRWLRRERVLAHERWATAEKCPRCNTMELGCTGGSEDSRGIRTTWECENGHRWANWTSKDPNALLKSILGSGA